MSSSPNEKAPGRLQDQPDETGALLRRAAHEFSSGLNEPAGWKEFGKRRARRKAAQWVGASALSMVAVIALLRAGGPPETIALTPEVHAEPVTSHAEAPPEPEQAPLPAATQLSRAVQPPPRPVDAREPATEKSCNAFAGARRFREAKDCFARLAEGNGLSAQLALLQVARLTAGPLTSPGRALALLDEHRARFPQSPLQGEVQQLKVSTLAAAGQHRRALDESEALLGTDWGRPLAAELHLLRGRIYEDHFNDCGRAVSEYVALLGVAGKAGDEAALRRARCLDKLGREKDALDAYRAYLRRGAPADEAVVRERIQRLSASSATGTKNVRGD